MSSAAIGVIAVLAATVVAVVAALAVISYRHMQLTTTLSERLNTLALRRPYTIVTGRDLYPQAIPVNDDVEGLKEELAQQKEMIHDVLHSLKGSDDYPPAPDPNNPEADLMGMRP